MEFKLLDIMKKDIGLSETHGEQTGDRKYIFSIIFTYSEKFNLNLKGFITLGKGNTCGICRAASWPSIK
jgi:hypothetical protein